MSRKYKNPPLIEAVCEFQFEPASRWDITIPGLVYERLKETFPIREQVSPEIEFTIVAGPDAAIQPQISSATERIRFLREDKKALVQVGPHLLSINHLKPYPTWEEYLPLINMAYGVYREVGEPQNIRRIGLRYINRIEIPSPNVSLEDFFQFYPYLGPDMPQQIGPFIIGIQTVYDKRDVLKAQLANAATERENCIGVVLDLDYSLLVPKQVELDDVVGWLQTAHNRIEQVFEACLTDRLRVMFEEEGQ